MSWIDKVCRDLESIQEPFRSRLVDQIVSQVCNDDREAELETVQVVIQECISELPPAAINATRSQIEQIIGWARENLS
jgi:hypothetical protein